MQAVAGALVGLLQVLRLLPLRLELAQAFGISSIPTLLAVRDGVVLYAEPGALPAPAFEDLINKVQQVDMDEVRAEIERAG